MLSSHLHLGLPRILYAPLASPMHARCPTHLIILALITLIILGEEYKPRSSFQSFLKPLDIQNFQKEL
jgi:hypothetical protein